MRSALICLFFTFIVREGSWADNDFRPTPIPLNEWHEVRDSASYEDTDGALQEAPQTLAPLSVDAATPARYWEDALRHCVYLTLVRDKIDELVAKEDVLAPDSKPISYAASENDDYDLWEKIKTAPFNRIGNDDFVKHGDVAIIAKGRLMQENGRFHFTQDELDKEKCKDDKCNKGIKAIWSVKRVRQREVEASPGRYHYELTFSVASQLKKEKRKHQANLVRTFTVRESTPERVVDMPQENRKVAHPKHRPQRVVWFHKNISPHLSTPNEGRQHKNGLERLFSSLFSDEDNDYLPPRHRKVIPYNPAYGSHGSAHSQPPYTPYSKVGYVGSPSDQQKRLTYPYKQNTYKYSRPIPPPPYAYGPKPHYLETESVGASFSNPHLTPPEYVHSPLGKPILTTKPAVLPTPIASSNKTNEKEKSRQVVTESATRVPEIVTGKPITRPRPGPIKINYLPDHVRPPVYNAPPGIFVTMDKKPFKPMPPLKLKMKPYKMSRPTDFRPSPQVLDMQQFSEPDPFKETAFRPITWNYQDTTNSASTTENTEHTERNTTVSTTVITPTQKNYTKGKRPPKKHENIKSQLTTTSPDIITGNASFEEETEPDVEWVNLINAFSKTTPMASQKQKNETTESSTRNSSSTTETSTIIRRRTSTTTEAEEVEEETTSSTTSTTVKPRKRTRPPPKFTKPDKVKKHKRITTSTTTQPPEKDKTTLDLTPQASSAAAKPARSTTERTTTITTTTTSKPTSPTYSTTKTTTKPTSTEAPTTTEKNEISSSTTQPKIKNRFRQSTLLQKGTSVNHDKWSSLGISTKAPSTLPSVFPPRRKGSNFPSYATPSDKLHDKKHNLFHEDKNLPLSVQPLSTATPHYEEHVSRDSISLEHTKENLHEDDDIDDVDDVDDVEDGHQNNEDDDNEEKEFIFSQSSSLTRSDDSSENNEIFEDDSYTTEQIITTQGTLKNLTKCQKKKLFNSSTTDQPTVVSANVHESDNSTDTQTVLEDNNTRSGSTSGFLEELIQSFTGDDAPSAKNPRLADFDQHESESQSHFVKLDDDLQDFLDSLDKDRTHANDYEDDDGDSSLILDEDDDDDGSPIDKWEHKEAPRQRHTDADDEYRDRPYGLLELLAME